MTGNFVPAYSPWRHGGWYVHNVRYPSGAVGCVSRNYPDGKWRIVCDSRPDAYERHTYPSRDAAARAELVLAQRAQCVEDSRRAQCETCITTDNPGQPCDCLCPVCTAAQEAASADAIKTAQKGT